MLEKYKKMRNFSKTPEPAPKISGSKKSIFVIQRHHATRLHYDFRIEYKGVLKSWAVPKGPSMNTGEKRLAVQTEDHPIDYAKFRGVIPEGNYGAGRVEIWDNGTFEAVKPLGPALEKGHVIIDVKGRKINGKFAFIRTRNNNNWLLMKMKDDFARNISRVDNPVKIGTRSIEITNPAKEIFSGIEKIDFVSYYSDMAENIIPHLKERPITMVRFPDGPGRKMFYQKNMPDYFPDWFDSELAYGVKYPVCSTKSELVYLANQVCELHVWTSSRPKLGFPDRMLFDLDPSSEDFTLLRKTAASMGDFLKKIGLHPFIMTSGGKGFHISVPVKSEFDNEGVRAFALKIAHVVAGSNPEKLTTELSKSKRNGRLFIDVNRNSRGQTSVAPFTVRAKEGAPVAAPFEWEDMTNVEPKTYSITNPPGTDPWKKIDRKAVSLKKIIARLRR